MLTILYCNIESRGDCVETIINGLVNIHQWLTSNKLSLNNNNKINSWYSTTLEYLDLNINSIAIKRINLVSSAYM